MIDNNLGLLLYINTYNSLIEQIVRDKIEKLGKQYAVVVYNDIVIICLYGFTMSNLATFCFSLGCEVWHKNYIVKVQVVSNE